MIFKAKGPNYDEMERNGSMAEEENYQMVFFFYCHRNFIYWMCHHIYAI